MRSSIPRVIPALAAAVLAGGFAFAQVPINLPQPSPAASVTQTVGMTEITISYHRPAVNKRKVWGELVPYGAVWRAGGTRTPRLRSRLR